jgi:hypothetical protein
LHLNGGGRGEGVKERFMLFYQLHVAGKFQISIFFFQELTTKLVA